MVVRGRVHRGVVVIDEGPPLPEGTEVFVSVPETVRAGTAGRVRVRLPLVPSDRPGSVALTADRVAGLLDEDDVPA